MSKKELGRRKFLSLSATAVVGATLAACAPSPTPQVVEKVVTKEVEKVVTKEVEKVVKETSVVEKVMTATPVPAKYPPGELVLWSWGTPQYQEDYMNDFLLTHYPGAGIKGVAQGTGGDMDIQTKLMLDWAAGCTACPDFVQSSEIAFRPMAKAGAVVDLTDWVSQIKSKMPDGIFNSFTIDGKVWCFPWRPNTWMMYYNRDIFAKAGITPEAINTWDDWITAGAEIKKATNGESFLEYRDGGSVWHTIRMLVPMAGGRFLDDNFNVVVDKDEKTLEVFMMLEKMYKADILYITPSWNPGWYQAFRDGKIAAIHYGNWWDEFLKKNLADMAGKWGLMQMPAFSNGAHKVPVTAVPFCIVNKPNAPYRDLIFELLEWQFLDKERVVEYLHLMTNRQLTAFLPVLKEVYTDPFFSQPDDYYAGQSFQAEVIKSLEGAPPMPPVKPNQLPVVEGIVEAEVANVYAGKQDMQTAIQKIAEQLKEKVEEIMDAP